MLKQASNCLSLAARWHFMNPTPAPVCPALEYEARKVTKPLKLWAAVLRRAPETLLPKLLLSQMENERSVQSGA